jgi:branched-chain amino acid transport system substrate-binding protein
MPFQFVVVPVGALLIAAPGVGDAAQHVDRIDALLQIATDVGHATNTASVCREISWPRIKALTDRFSDLVKASGANGEEFSSIQQAYDQSAIDGQRTLSSKHTDCAAAVRDLADLERAVTGASPVQARTATVASPPSAGATTGAALPQHPGQRRER